MCRLRTLLGVLVAVPAAVAQPVPTDAVAPPAAPLPLASPTPITSVALPALLTALDANPGLRAEYLAAAAAAERPTIEGAWPDPMADGMLRVLPAPWAMGPQRAQIGLTQPIPYPGTRRARTAAAQAEADAMRYDADAMRADLALEVAMAYTDWLRIVEQQALIDTFATRLAGYADVAATRYEVGRGMQADVLMAQLERTRLQEMTLRLEAEAAAQRAMIARLLNQPLPPTAAPTPFLVVPLAADSLVADAQALRPEARALDAAAAQATQQEALAHLAGKPSFQAGVMVMDMGMPDERDGLFVTFGATLPINRAPVRAAVAEARLRQQAVDAQRDAFATRVQADVQTYQARLDAEARTRRLLQTTLRPQADLTTESLLAAYSTGAGSFLDLLEAERMRFDLAMAANEAAMRHRQAALALARTLGQDLAATIVSE